MRLLIFCLIPLGFLQSQTPEVPAARAPIDVRAKTAAAFEDPMCAGMDVSVALDLWFKAVATDSPDAADKGFAKSAAALAGVKPLPQATWAKDVPAAEYRTIQSTALKDAPEITLEIVSFKVDNLLQYAVVVRPSDKRPRPLIVYLHGAAFGVPTYSIPTLVHYARQGYAVAAPALRGEPLFAGLSQEQSNKFTCEGKIENLLGEPRDVAGLGLALLDQPWVAGDGYAVIGHSFGAGAGLLAAARRPEITCVVSYDAWLTNAFRFYWERLRGGSQYYWGSWEQYTEHPIKDQLSGLMARSVVHHADRIQAPTLLFVGEHDAPGYHRSHEELATRLKKASKTFRYEVIPEGGHNFVLYPESPAAQLAKKLEIQWLETHFPAGVIPTPIVPAVTEQPAEK